MKFCMSLCENDQDCQAFEYDFNNPGKKQNCKTFSFSGYKGSGNEQAICFLKNNGTVPIDWEDEVKPVNVTANSTNSTDPTAIKPTEWVSSEDPPPANGGNGTAAANQTEPEQEPEPEREEVKIDITLIEKQSYCVDNFQLSIDSDTLNECAQKTIIEKRCFEGSDFFFYRDADQMCSCCTDQDPLENTAVPFYDDVNLYKRNTDASPCKENKCQRCSTDGRTCSECLPEFKLIMGACFKFD